MPLEPTETRVFEILEVGDLIRSPQGHSSIECRTDAGTVAFWCGRLTSNLRSMQRRATPFYVRCGCRPPLPNFPTHAWWVPDGAKIEFLEGRIEPPPRLPEPSDVIESAPLPPPEAFTPVASPFRALAREGRTLYVVSATKSTIWDDDPQGEAFVPALYAYRGRTVKEWLGSEQRAQAAHWLFLSARYGLIEPQHPIASSEASFADKATGPISDDALRVQVECQRRWNEQIPLREFQTVYTWCESTPYEDRARTAFELVGAKVVRLKALTRAT